MPQLPVRGGAGLFDEADERLVAHRLDVLAVLQHRAERLLDDLGIDLFTAERGKGLCPVDRFRDTRRLREIDTAQPDDEGGSLLRKALGDPRDEQHHDLDLALDRRMADPADELASLERDVKLPSA